MELTYEQRLEIAVEFMTEDSYSNYFSVCRSLKADDPVTIEE